MKVYDITQWDDLLCDNTRIALVPEEDLPAYIEQTSKTALEELQEKVKTDNSEELLGSYNEPHVFHDEYVVGMGKFGARFQFDNGHDFYGDVEVAFNYSLRTIWENPIHKGKTRTP